jgi:hypothetical protein
VYPALIDTGSVNLTDQGINSLIIYTHVKIFPDKPR